MRIGKYHDVIYFGTMIAFSMYFIILAVFTIISLDVLTEMNLYAITEMNYKGVLLITMWILLILFYILSSRFLHSMDVNELVTLKDNTFN